MTKMTKLTIESTGYSDVKRIMDGDAVYGMAVQYTSGFWAPHDAHTDKRLAPPAFKTANQVKKWFEENMKND